MNKVKVEWNPVSSHPYDVAMNEKLPVQMTMENAHRAKLIRRKDKPESEPIPFFFRRHYAGGDNYIHYIQENGTMNELSEYAFDRWEITEVKYPGYLADCFSQAVDSNVFVYEAEVYAESDIMEHEVNIHCALKYIPENRWKEYVEEYRKHFLELMLTHDREKFYEWKESAADIFENNNNKHLKP